METTANPGPTVTSGFDSRWHVLPGMAHGLRQPVMLGRWLGPWSRPDSLVPLDRLMESVLTERLPPALAASANSLAQAQRLLFWAAAAQRHFQVPVFEPALAWCDPTDPLRERLAIAMPYWVPDASWAALRWACKQAQGWLMNPARRSDEVLTADFEQLGRSLQAFRVNGYNTIRFLRAAHELDIPTRPVVHGVHAFGQGLHSHWLESSYTERTPVIGARLARDKFLTAQVLRQLGFPTPVHARAASAQQAVELARQLGYPVVVKPVDRDQGLGVQANLPDDAAVVEAFRNATKYSTQILVEKHAYGIDHRLTVLHGRLIKTVMRRPAGVTGDGHGTVAELIDIARREEPRLGPGNNRGHEVLVLDAEALSLLAQYGMSGTTVPVAGQHVALRRRANMSAGGTPILITGAVHPDNRRLAERACVALGLDIAGVDLILPDIARSWLETGAVICEVNAQPQIGSSTTPGIYADMLRELLAPRWRIPVVLVVGAAAPAGLEAGSLTTPDGSPWGFSDSQGVWQGLERLCGPSANSYAAACVLAANRELGAVTVVMEPAQILASGLPFDRIDLLVLADTGARALPSAQAHTLWRRVLPHVRGAIVRAPQHATPLPESALLREWGLSIEPPTQAPSLLSEQVRGLLAARE